MFTFLMASSLSIYSIIKEYYKIEINWAIYSFYSLLCATILGVYSIIFYKQNSLGNLNFYNIFLLLSNGTLCFAGTFFTFTLAIKNIGAVKTTLISSFSPILTIILANIVLNEHITKMQFLGIVLIILSTLLIIKNKKND